MTAACWQKLYAHLVRVTPETPRPEEQMAFLLASSNRSALNTRLLVSEMIPASPADFVYQSRGGLEPRAEFVAATIKRCLKEGWHLIEVHSHPFDTGSRTTFSAVDWANDRKKMPALASIIPEPFLHATMVVGQKALDAHYYDRASQRIRPISQITLIGERVQHLPTTASRGTKRGKQIDERFHRQALFFGNATQHALAQATVAVVGLGGLGSLVATQLAHLGIGHLILIDPDRVERSNLNRLFGAGIADLGRTKVEVYAGIIKRISETTRVTALPLSLLDRSDQQAIAFARSADVIAGCVDNDGARLILNQIAVRYLIPLVDGGSGIHLDAHSQVQAAGGQVQRVLPGAGCLECRGYINPQRVHFDLAPEAFQTKARAHGYGTDAVAPSVIYLNGIVASQQVAEIVSLLSEVELTTEAQPPLMVYNALQRKLTPIHAQADPACPTCGLEGLSGIGDFAPITFATSTLSEEAVIQIMGDTQSVPPELSVESDRSAQPGLSPTEAFHAEHKQGKREEEAPAEKAVHGEKHAAPAPVRNTPLTLAQGKNVAVRHRKRAKSHTQQKRFPFVLKRKNEN
jgi:molybdopterin/thiamine biosynthesis adenylyltransferase